MLIIGVFVALGLLATAWGLASFILGARYDAARDRAWQGMKPRPPLRAYREIGEPPHASAHTPAQMGSRPGNARRISGGRP